MTDTEESTYKNKFELIKAMAEIESKGKQVQLAQGYIGAYLWSVLIPPIGIYFFIKYIFFADGETENIKAGIISLVLTLLSFFLSLWLLTGLFKQVASPIPLPNSEILKDLAEPNNQKNLFELLNFP